MPIWANQVSPLQNWCSIIYIHNDMINSVHYAELGEARLARRIDIENNLNSCAPHTAGEACLAPTIAPVARTLNLYLRLGCFFAPKGQQNSA